MFKQDEDTLSMKIRKEPYLNKWRHHRLPISSFVWGLVELQVKIKLANSALWDHLIAVHQGLCVCPEKEKKQKNINVQYIITTEDAPYFAMQNWYLPVVMPQLTVTSNQVDPLTQRWVFFFKCKNMYSLRNEANKC